MAWKSAWVTVSFLFEPAWMVTATRLSTNAQEWLSSVARRGLRRWAPARLLWPAVCLCWLASIAVAQEGTSEPKEPPDDPVPSILRDGLLQTDVRVELRGPDGKPVLTNITLEELRKLESQSNAASQLPAATLTMVNVKAIVSGHLAEVEGTFEVRLGTAQAPGQVDLRFGACQLTQQPQLPQEGVRSLFQPKREGGGYQWLLLGNENSLHALVLTGKANVQHKSDRHTLELDLPPALTTLDITLPANAIDERVRSEDLLERTVDEAGVHLKINSRGGDFSLTWRERGAVAPVAAVEAESNTTFEIIDPQHPWNATTILNVRWYGNDAAKQFRIQLPPGAQWRTFPNTEFERYRISTLDAPRNEGDTPPSPPTNGSQILLVETLELAKSESIQLLLEWEWLPPASESDSITTQVNVPMPTITGVNAHEGLIDCVFPVSYAAVFQEGPGARLIQQGRLANVFGRQQMQFRFDRQDFELALIFREEQSLPTVRPIYKVKVDQNKLVLTAWFDCTFDTSRQQMEIGLIPGDWIIEENTGRILRDPSSPFSMESEVLNVRRQDDGSYILSGREPDGGFGNNRRIEQVWRIVAERSWSPDDNNAIEFSIPDIIRGRANGTPEIDHGSGVLLVASVNSVLMQWNETASTGLLPDSFSTDYQKYVQETLVREPLAYRFQSRGTTPNWAGHAEFLPQQISFEQHCDIEVLASQVLVRQDFDLRIANEPLSNLRIAVRGDADPSPQVFINGNLTSIQAVGSIPASSLQPPTTAATTTLPDEAVAWKQFQLVGAPDLFGAATVSVLTTVPWSKPSSSENGSSVDISVPLAQTLLPAGARSIRQDWALHSDLKYDATLTAGNSYGGDTTLIGDKRRTLPTNQLELNLRLRERETPTESPIVVSGSWLQTVITGNERRDRYTARVRSESGKLTILLPNPAQIEKVAVDGAPLKQSAAPYDYNTKTLSIALADVDGSAEHVVELFYFMDQTLSWLTPIVIEPPRVENAEYQDRFYWQLVTPSDQHLGWSPASLTAEWIWQWGGFWWYRQSSEDQTSLERWLNSSTQTRQPLSANSYVMSGNGDARPGNVWVLSRFVLWFPVGLLAILSSVLALSLPFLRSPVTAILLAGCVIGLAMIWPDLAVLVGQTGVLSLSLVTLILVTQAAIDARVRRRSVFSARPSTYLDSSDQVSVSRGMRTGQTAALRTGSSVVAVGEKQ